MIRYCFKISNNIKRAFYDFYGSNVNGTRVGKCDEKIFIGRGVGGGGLGLPGGKPRPDDGPNRTFRYVG